MAFGQPIASFVADRSGPQRRSGAIQIQVKQNLIGVQSRGSLDEAGFQQLLAAAFVVQQHNDRLRLNRGAGVSYTKTLAEIVETEEQIKNGRLSLSSSLRLIVERARRLTRAEAAAVAMAEDNYLMYRATSGRCADEVGSRSKNLRYRGCEVFARRHGAAVARYDQRHQRRFRSVLAQRRAFAAGRADHLSGQDHRSAGAALR